MGMCVQELPYMYTGMCVHRDVWGVHWVVHAGICVQEYPYNVHGDVCAQGRALDGAWREACVHKSHAHMCMGSVCEVYTGACVQRGVCMG